MLFYSLYSLVFGLSIGALTSGCLDLFWSEHYQKGKTKDTKKLLGSFDWHCKKAYMPSILVWFDNCNGINCCCKPIDITPNNYELVKKVLITQNWKLILSENELKSIDIDSLNNVNGSFINGFVFSIDYCKRGVK